LFRGHVGRCPENVAFHREKIGLINLIRIPFDRLRIFVVMRAGRRRLINLIESGSSFVRVISTPFRNPGIRLISLARSAIR